MTFPPKNIISILIEYTQIYIYIHIYIMTTLYFTHTHIFIYTYNIHMISILNLNLYLYIYIYIHIYMGVLYFFNGVLFIHGIQTHPPFEKEFLNSTEEFGGSVSIEAGDARHFGVGVYPYIYIYGPLHSHPYIAG